MPFYPFWVKSGRGGGDERRFAWEVFGWGVFLLVLFLFLFSGEEMLESARVTCWSVL